MKYQFKIILSFFAIVTGWLVGAFGFMTTLGHPVSTICFLGGLGMSFCAFVYLAILASKKRY